jgi:hypothetical protein
MFPSTRSLSADQLQRQQATGIICQLPLSQREVKMTGRTANTVSTIAVTTTAILSERHRRRRW